MRPPTAPLPPGFDDLEAFEQLRLRPFHETVIERRPELADGIEPLLEELRTDRRCFVHGDYSLKNMLVGPDGNWVLDFEVAHHGNPVFDLGFFLSFVVLSAIRWEPLAPELVRARVTASCAATTKRPARTSRERGRRSLPIPLR